MFVGENDKDESEFRLFVGMADAAATAQLNAIAAGAGPAYGMNMSCPRLPAGTRTIDETRPRRPRVRRGVLARVRRGISLCSTGAEVNCPNR